MYRYDASDGGLEYLGAAARASVNGAGANDENILAVSRGRADRVLDSERWSWRHADLGLARWSRQDGRLP